MSKQSEELAALKKKVEELEAKVSPPKSDFKPMTDAEWRDQMHQAAERRMSLAIPRALLAPGTSTVWPTSTTTRNEARAQLSEAAWLGFWMRCWARSPSAPAASRVIAIITPRYFVAARTPIIRLTSYRSGRKFPLPSSEIGYEGLILFAPWCRCGRRSAPQGSEDPVRTH